jgi:hypothetical protein
MNDDTQRPGKGEEAQPRDILAKLRIRQLEPLQWVGLWLALAFFAYIILASGTIFFVSFRGLQLPSPPTSPSSSGDVDQYKRLVDAYKQSADIYQQMAKLQVERATQLFQLVVASTILPVFSAILGYIFGSKKSGE